MNKPRHTPWLLLLIGGGFLALTGWSIYQASQGTSAVTDRNYYSHGLRYNETLLEKKAAESLGWHTRIALQGRQVSIFLRDRDDTPVNEARATLTVMATGKYHAATYPLHEITAGQYGMQLPEDLHGEFTADILFEREGVQLNKRILLSID